MRRLTIAIALAALVLAMFAAPASATVHEIVGQQCSGQADLFPPGISGGSNADNFAQPLFANGFASVVPFDPGDGRDPGFLVSFDFDHPASKVVGTGIYIQFEELPDGSPLYLELFELDSSHGFTNCKNLRHLR